MPHYKIKHRFSQLSPFDAIHVAAYADIPCDYAGMMGVPVSYMAYHCPEQFDIIGELKHGQDGDFDLAKPILNGEEKYMRIVIQNKNPEEPLESR